MLLLAKKSFVRKSAEEKKEQVQQLLDSLEEGVLNFKNDPEKFKAILAMQALLPSYSFRNTMLIQRQLPGARYTASFTHWKSLNRFVRKGEKSLRILAPRFKKEVDVHTGREVEKLVGYTDVPVFDVSQTEGDPLPLDSIRLVLEGESDEAVRIFEWVKLLAEEDDCILRVGFANGACGYYRISEHSIMIDESLSINHRAKTAVHELVHSRVHRHDRESTPSEKECVAEGTAFIICSYFGLDTSDYSFEYVRGWAEDDGASLLKYGAIIQETAQQLINDFERVATAIAMPISVENEESLKQEVA